MGDKAYITPNVLKWARESARMAEDVAAKKVSVPTEKLLEWEEGKSQPTINQAQLLAKAYKRPFALFFLPDIPRDFQPLQDFRKTDSKPLGTASIFIIREIQQKQAWISELNKENDIQPISFVGRYSISDDPIVVANDILSTLGIDPLNYNTQNPIKEWIDKAESRGIFISRTSFIHSRLLLDSQEIQGFAIADSFAPFVFINSDDWDAPQLFTLVHELAHIWIAASGISNDIYPELKSRDRYTAIELFCNEVAANALMPVHIMEQLNKSNFENAKEIYKIAKGIGVSSKALLVRAFNLNMISSYTYNSLSKELDIEFKAFLSREEEKRLKQKENDKQGGPNPFLLLLNRNSRLFTQTVLDAFRSGVIEPTMASSLLNTQTTKFSKLEAQLYK